MKIIYNYAVVGSLIASACVAAWVTENHQSRDKADVPFHSVTTNASGVDSSGTAITGEVHNLISNQTKLNSELSVLPPAVDNKVPGESQTNGEIEFLIGRFKDLMYIDSPGFSMEERIAAEENILTFFSENPDSISQIFDLYADAHDPEYKQTIIDMLSMTENPQVEQFALNQISNELDDHTVSWLQILRSTGISAADDRADLLSRLYQYSDPKTLSNAISTLKFRPVPAPQSERQEIVTRLQVYLTHEDPAVQQAASAVIANWSLESRQDPS